MVENDYFGGETVLINQSSRESEVIMINPSFDIVDEHPELSEHSDEIIVDLPQSSLSDDEDYSNDLFDDSIDEDEPSADLLASADRTLKEDLAEVFIQKAVPRNTVNSILKKLVKHGVQVPKDYRKLLHTPRSISIKKMAGGDYVSFDINGELHQAVVGTQLRRLTIDTHIDGVPVANSTIAQFNVITSRIKELDYVFVAGIFYGKHKPPDVNEFLAPYILKLKDLVNEGLSVRFYSVRIVIGHFNCDAIARAPILNIKHPTGYYSCHQCKVRHFFIFYFLQVINCINA